MRARLLLPLLLLTRACVVDTAVPADARLTCGSDAHCPDGWTCESDLCRAPGWQPDTVQASDTGDEADALPARWDDKLALCGALYDKGTTCEPEVRAGAGDDVWAWFASERPTFVQGTCPADLLADASDADLDEYLGYMDLIAAAPCGLFVTTLCGLIPLDAGLATSCPE